MRTTVASLGSITVLLVGVYAISESAQQSKDTALNASNSSSTAWNVSNDVFNGVLQGGGEGIVWFGVAAVIIVALGFLVTAGRSGGR